MYRVRLALVVVLATAFLAAGGCFSRKGNSVFTAPYDAAKYRQMATEIEYPNIETPLRGELLDTPPPLSLVRGDMPKYRDITLEEAVQAALTNNQVIRDLGGSLLRAPDAALTVQIPAIVETDPRFGTDAALSAFDAQFTTTLFYEQNHRAFNNSFFGGGTRLFSQDAIVMQSQIAKTAATGDKLSFRHNTDYDSNNAPANQFPSAWNTNFEAEVRHPWLLNSGVEYNRIAGPAGIPGIFNGVLLARLRTDVSLTEFEAATRNLVSDVENAYWDLYFAYRDLDSKVQARNAALDTWRRINSLATAGRQGGEAEKEAYAREEYFRFEEEVQNSLAGAASDGTRGNNGSSGGTFRGNGGLQATERRFRLLIGLPITDGDMLRPVDEPRTADIVFQWQDMVSEALERRVELRRQRWLVKRRELELTASRNFLKPQLDTVGRYRLRGFGQNLVGSETTATQTDFSNAWGNLLTGQFQEYQAGMEFSMPLGFRKGHAAVRNAELNLMRERTVLREQERQVIHDLSAAIAEKDRAFMVLQTVFNRRQAAAQQLEAIWVTYNSDRQGAFENLLFAQRVMADANTRYYRALIEYAIAIKNIHYEKGSLLDFNSVRLAEGPWPSKAYRDAARRDSIRVPVGPLDYTLKKPVPVAAPNVVPNGAIMQPLYVPPPSGQPTEVVPTPAEGIPTPAPAAAQPQVPVPAPAPAPPPSAPPPMPRQGLPGGPQGAAAGQPSSPPPPPQPQNVEPPAASSAPPTPPPSNAAPPRPQSSTPTRSRPSTADYGGGAAA
jgi:hypothetical protein